MSKARSTALAARSLSPRSKPSPAKKNTLALVGSHIVIYERALEIIIAAFNDHLRHLATTLTKNMKLPVEKSAAGFFQRTVQWIFIGLLRQTIIVPCAKAPGSHTPEVAGYVTHRWKLLSLKFCV